MRFASAADIVHLKLGRTWNRPHSDQLAHAQDQEGIAHSVRASRPQVRRTRIMTSFFGFHSSPVEGTRQRTSVPNTTHVPKAAQMQGRLSVLRRSPTWLDCTCEWPIPCLEHAQDNHTTRRRGCPPQKATSQAAPARRSVTSSGILLRFDTSNMHPAPSVTQRSARAAQFPD